MCDITSMIWTYFFFRFSVIFLSGVQILGFACPREERIPGGWQALEWNWGCSLRAYESTYPARFPKGDIDVNPAVEIITSRVVNSGV